MMPWLSHGTLVHAYISARNSSDIILYSGELFNLAGKRGKMLNFSKKLCEIQGEMTDWDGFDGTLTFDHFTPLSPLNLF